MELQLTTLTKSEANKRFIFSEDVSKDIPPEQMSYCREAYEGDFVVLLYLGKRVLEQHWCKTIEEARKLHQWLTVVITNGED
jgi:MoaA/NifB/PqqE/SkfB family radical SAM enzyme